MSMLSGEMYPDIEPFSTGMLKVSDLHSIYYEESGNKNGNPIVYFSYPILFIAWLLNFLPSSGQLAEDLMLVMILETVLTKEFFFLKQNEIVQVLSAYFTVSSSVTGKTEIMSTDIQQFSVIFKTVAIYTMKILDSDMGAQDGVHHLVTEHFLIRKFTESFSDQRGTGKSTPPAELRENTTWDLVNDMEQLREKLEIDKWIVFGGSWGSTLALVYAETHPDRVKALVIRGIYTFRRRELVWYYQDGASLVFPDAFEKFVRPIPEIERYDVIGAFYRRLIGNDKKAKLECARAWGIWAVMTSRLYIDKQALAQVENDLESWLQKATIECHYLVHSAFLKADDQILSNVKKIRHIPTTIVQGRYDIVCPPETALKLHELFPEAELSLVPDGGHSRKDKGIEKALLEACEKYKHL